MKFIRFWLPVILWMMVIFVFSSRQKVALTDSYTLSFLFFKTLHIIEYAFLFIVSFRAFKNTSSFKLKYVFIAAFLFTALYAMTDEMHQLYVPTREGKVRDVIIDCIGGGVGWIILLTVFQKARKTLKRLLVAWQLM